MSRVATPTSEGERHEARRRWLTTVQAGELLGGVDVSTVRELIRDGHLKAYNAARPGAKRADWRLLPEWVEEYRRKRMNAA